MGIHVFQGRTKVAEAVTVPAVARKTALRNAKLIAAAPDMHEILKAVQELDSTRHPELDSLKDEVQSVRAHHELWF